MAILWRSSQSLPNLSARVLSGAWRLAVQNGDARETSHLATAISPILQMEKLRQGESHSWYVPEPTLDLMTESGFLTMMRMGVFLV